MDEFPSAIPLRQVCAWCKAQIRAGREPISHGICPKCAARVKDEWKQALRRDMRGPGLREAVAFAGYESPRYAAQKADPERGTPMAYRKLSS
jgi:predicted amidophosphoribosyltransferase